jgi:hypothetical protein
MASFIGRRAGEGEVQEEHEGQAQFLAIVLFLVEGVKRWSY